MLIKIEELEIGDEIIISGNSHLKYLKVLKKPSLSNKKNMGKNSTPNGTFDWSETGIKYKAVRCSTYQEQITHEYDNGVKYTHKEYVFESNVTKHNVKISIDLTGRDIYLAKREKL